jgi:hypothetical protein
LHKESVQSASLLFIILVDQYVSLLVSLNC